MKKYLYAVLLGSSNLLSAAPYLYLPYSGDIISIFDTSNNSITKSISVGYTFTGPQTNALAINPAATEAFITMSGNNEVTVLNLADNKSSAIGVGSYPVAIAFNASGSQAYVVNESSKNVSIIDTASHTVATTVTVGNNPVAVATQPNGGGAYVAVLGENSVAILGADNTVTKTVNVGSKPTAVAVNPSGTLAYISNSGSDSVSVLDTASSSITATITVGKAPSALAVSPDGAKVYVINSGGDNVSVIDAATNTVTTNLPMGLAFNGTGAGVLSTNSAGTILYVYNWSRNLAVVVDTATQKVSDVIDVDAFLKSSVSVTKPNPVACLFDWAGTHYPEYFKAATGDVSLSNYQNYSYRYHTSTDSYLGLSSLDSHVYYIYGTDRSIKDAGLFSDWLVTSGCQ